MTAGKAGSDVDFVRCPIFQIKLYLKTGKINFKIQFNFEI